MTPEQAQLLLILMGVVAVGAFVGQCMVWVGRRGNVTATEPMQPTRNDARTPQPTNAAHPLPLAHVLSYLNDKVDDAPHCFIVGSTGAGKSTFAKLLLAPRVQRGEQFVILTGKRTAAFSGLPCIGRDGVGDYTSVNAMFDALLAELIRRDTTPLENRNFTTLNVVIDDATILLAESETAVQFFRECALIGREISMRMLIILGSLRVKELGIEGRGDLREHFAVVTYHKTITGSRVTTLRPRFDEADDTPFDASPVPMWADKVRINAAQAWKAEATPDADRILASMLSGKKHADTDGNAEGDFSASESDFTTSRLPFTTAEIAKIAASIGAGNGKTDVVTSMPRYSGRKHKEYSRYYDEIAAMVMTA